MSTYKDTSSLTVGRGFSRLADLHTADGESYVQGLIFTPHGIVAAYAQGDERHGRFTNLEFLDVRAGRIRQRQILCRLTHRGIVTAAKKFARQMSR